MDRPATSTNQGGQQVEPECPSIKVERKKAAQKIKVTEGEKSHEKVSIKLENLFSNEGNKATKSLFKNE
jgi:hypothetical protein